MTSLLWRAVSDYLKGLYDKYEPPEKGPDSRKRFYDATFISGVVRCVKPYLNPVRSDMFDQNPHMLGLPDCRVIDLRTRRDPGAKGESRCGYFPDSRLRVRNAAEGWQPSRSTAEPSRHLRQSRDDM